jgi:uncharacterized protein YjbJ (UPF0337 family)
MNADQLRGRWMQFKGELKGKWGQFTDNDLTEIDGNFDKFVGKVHQRYGDKKSELMKWAEAGMRCRRLKPRESNIVPLHDGKAHKATTGHFTLIRRR